MSHVLEEAFVKLALNALKARQLAKGYGLVPDHTSQWKWALRQLRKGKTPEDLGRLPAGLRRKMIDASQRGTVETGTTWTRDGRHPLPNVGDMGRVNVYGGRKRADEIVARLEGKANPRKVLNRFVNRMKKKNTAHLHPDWTLGEIQVELVKANALSPALRSGLKDAPDGSLLRLVAEERDEVIRRGASKRPDLAPSEQDIDMFSMANLGTHHNIVVRGSAMADVAPGVGVHTHRGKKFPRGLRSVYYEGVGK